MKLWLDDVRPAPDGWSWAGTAENAVDLINRHHAEITDVSLDHDLGTKKDGNYVAQHIARYKQIPLDVPIRVHSWNPSGARTMAYWVSRSGYSVEVRPYSSEEAA